MTASSDSFSKKNSTKKNSTGKKDNDFFKDLYKKLENNGEHDESSNIGDKNDKQHSLEEILSCHDVNSMQNHNQYYDSILKDYSDNIKKSLDSKLELKKDFYQKCINIIIGLILIQVVVVLAVLCCYRNGIYLSDKVVSIISLSSIGGLLTSFIVLPVIIAKYLFNPNEEKYIIKIIRNIQSHDKSIRNYLFKNKKHKNE